MSQQVHAAVSATAVALTAEDNAAIQRLGAVYAMCSDYRRFEDLGALFEPDAVWDGTSFRFGRHEGRDSIVEGIKVFCPEGAQQIHFALPAVTWDLGEDRAGGVSYFTAVKKGERGTQQAYGCYEDTYSRKDGTWRFASRTLVLRLVP